MKDKISLHIYRIAIGTMVFSAVLMLFVQNTAPFGLSASWSTQGLGSSLVLTHSAVTAKVGDSVVKSTELHNEVAVFNVQEIVRRDGVLFYQLSDGTNESVTVPAVEVGRTALMSIPFVGVFVRMLSYPIGGMALIGLPLLMMLINYGMLVVQKVLPTLSLLERSAEKKEKKSTVYEEEHESEMTTVLKPYRFKRKLSLQ